MTSQFAILHFAEGWRVLFNGEKRGRFRYREDAVTATLRLAGDVERQGRAVEFLVQDRFGEVTALALGGRTPASSGTVDQ